MMFTSIACFSYSYSYSYSPCLALYSQRCPVAAYADEEYGRMWAGSNAVGLIGLVLNVYMCMTWSDQISYLLLLLYLLSACAICFLIYNLGHVGLA